MNKTKKQINSRNNITIIAGFFSVLILLASLMVIAITRIENNEQQIHQVSQELTEVSNAYIMRDAANNRALLLYRMAQTEDDFLRDDLYTEFNRFGAIFVSSFNNIQENLHRQSDIDLFDLTKKTIRKGGQSQSITAVDIIEGKIEKAHRDLTTKIIPIQTDVRKQLTQLSNSFKQNAKSQLGNISQQNYFSILLISIIGLIAILLGLLITSYVTRRVTKTERAYIQQRQIAIEANQAKTLFLATMSHEIRSPLAAIIGFSDLLRKSTMSVDKSHSCIESIHRNGQHLLQLINDILDITKIEAGQLDIERVTSSPFDVLEEFKSTVAINAKHKGLNFKINYAFPLPKTIKTDPARLKQILYNLSNNAIKFTSRGGINITVSFDKERQDMTFDVIDTGIGLTQEQQNKIFNSFTQADSSSTREYGGTGLGLNICKQLSLKLGGTISVKSTVNRGSKFSFSIATGDISNDALVYSLDHQLEEQHKKNPGPMSKLQGHVLLAEDTVDNQKLIEIYITDTGATISIVCNGAEAVKICESQTFDLILMDMQMPVMDGIEAIKIIRKSNTATPIISLTANAMKSDYEKCIDAGANEFITKPIDATRFNQMLYKYLKNTQNNQGTEKKLNKLAKLTEKFLLELPTRLDLINTLFAQCAWSELENETHKLKAIGTPFGFPEITDYSDKINLSCRNKNYDAITNLIEKLNNFCKGILA